MASVVSLCLFHKNLLSSRLWSNVMFFGWSNCDYAKHLVVVAVVNDMVHWHWYCYLMAWAPNLSLRLVVLMAIIACHGCPMVTVILV